MSTTTDTREIPPTREHAAGMLAGILAQRRWEGLGECAAYAQLDLDNPTDRRIIGSVYALMAMASRP